MPYAPRLRGAVLGLATLCTFSACSSLSDEEEQKLELHRQSAWTYLQGKDFPQARRQARMGLEIDEDDYSSLMTYALASGYLAGDNFEALTQAELSYEKTYDKRDKDDHDPLFLLEYAKIEQRLSAMERRLAGAFQSESENENLSEDDREKRRARAESLTELADRRSGRAEDALETLVDRGDLTRTANRILMAIAAERGEMERAIEYGKTSLKALADQREYFEEVVEKDYEYRRERQARVALEDLDTEEQLVRSLLAEIYAKTEQLPLAIEQLDLLLEKYPTRSDDYYNRGRAHELLGNIEKARSDYLLFLSTNNSLDNSDPRVIRAFKFTDGGS